MADMADLDLPIALRRARRSSVGVKAEPETHQPQTAPKTPRRRKKAVRFSDPGPSSSGLTPMIRRTAITTPKRRHSSAPSRFSGNGALTPSSSVLRHNEPASFDALHQTAEGRVERRLRRNGLREMLNKIELDKRRKAKTAQAEIARLNAEVRTRDREIYELQNATVVIDTERIWDLEQQVDDLKAELHKRTRSDDHSSRNYSWTLAAKDPFTDDFMDIMPDEDHFGDATMAQLHASTPSRARSSFPTPPATSPLIPSTPCFKIAQQTPMSHVGVQAHLPDPAKQQLEEELASLQLEVCKLTATLDSYKSLGTRVNDLLSTAAPVSTGEISMPPIEAIEGQVQALLQTMSDRTAALTHLTSAISDLGFPGNDASDMIMSLASGFRAARLELEYLTPGEVTLPLTSHGAEVLDLLLTRLRTLAKKVKEDENSIDEYHSIEQSLRKQLDARVSVMDGLKAEMSKAQELMDDKNSKIQELEIGNERLKGAVDGYVRDISELEKLVGRMEQQSRNSAEAHLARQRSNEELLATKDANIAELEAKIGEAVDQTAELLKEMGDIEASITTQRETMNKQHGTALALRDARVTELRSEIDRVNESLRAAHETIRVLRVENGGLRAQLEEEEKKARNAVDSMKEELQRVLQMSQEFLNSPKLTSQNKEIDGASSSPMGLSTVVQPGGYYITGDLARRGSKKLRRRYDSGLGLLNEDEVDI